MPNTHTQDTTRHKMHKQRTGRRFGEIIRMCGITVNVVHTYICYEQLNIEYQRVTGREIEREWEIASGVGVKWMNETIYGMWIHKIQNVCCWYSTQHTCVLHVQFSTYASNAKACKIESGILALSLQMKTEIRFIVTMVMPFNGRVSMRRSKLHIVSDVFCGFSWPRCTLTYHILQCLCCFWGYGPMNPTK